MELLTETAVNKYPRILYHYTSQAAFLAILQTGVLWASNLLYLNDSLEFNMAKEVMLHQLRVYPAGAALEVELLHGIAQKLGHLSGEASYSVSFSCDGDSLEMWRSYSGQGTGYAIGFDPQRVGALNEEVEAYLGRCVYEDKEQANLFISFLDQKIQELRRACGSMPEADALKLTLGNTNNLFLKCAPFIKDDSFAHEQEWRLSIPHVQDDDAGLFCHPGKTMLIPHFEINLRDKSGFLPIKDVTVGPNPHMELAITSTSRALRGRAKGCSVGNSVVPYRNW